MKHAALINKIKDLYETHASKLNINERLPDAFCDDLKLWGFKSLGSGASRSAYGNGKLVVKIGNIGSNANEWFAFNKYNNHPIFSQLIIPMYSAYGHLKSDTLLFCEQAEKCAFHYNDECILEPVDEIISLKQKQVYDKQISQFRMLERLFYDNHLGNARVYNGNLVCIDLNCERPDERYLDAKLRGIDIDKLCELYDIDTELICDSYYEKQVS